MINMDSIQTNPILFWLFLLTVGVALGLLIIVLVAARLVSAIRTIRGGAEPREVHPQPLVVEEAQQFATKDDVEKLAQTLNHYIESETRESASRRRGIYDRIDENHQVTMDKIEQTRLEVEAKIKEVHGRVDTLPDRVIALLRNTGVIK